MTAFYCSTFSMSATRSRLSFILVLLLFFALPACTPSTEQAAEATAGAFREVLSMDLSTRSEVLEAMGRPVLFGARTEDAYCYSGRSSRFVSEADLGEATQLCFVFDGRHVQEVQFVLLFENASLAREYAQALVALRGGSLRFQTERDGPLMILRLIVSGQKGSTHVLGPAEGLAKPQSRRS